MEAETSALASLLGAVITQQVHPERVEAWLENGCDLRIEVDPDDENLVVVVVDDETVARLEKSLLKAVADVATW